MQGWHRQALPAGLLLLASAALVSVLLIESSDGPSALLSKDGALSDKKELLSKLRGILKEKVSKQHQIGSQVKAWVAASAMKSDSPAAHKVQLSQNWKSLRSDWKPYNPSISLAENVAKQQKVGDAREQQLSEQAFIKRSAKPSIAAHQTAGSGDEKRVVRYESHYHHAGGPGGYDGANGCKNWGEHPLACIREQYHNHLRATKFASLRRRYDGKVTRDSLDHERNVIADKVSEGLVQGKLAVPKHGPVKAWVKEQKQRMHAARQAELRKQVQSEQEQAAHQEALHDIARDWGSGVAGSGPDAGRRYYVNYATGRTAFTAPAYVKHALQQLRTEQREEEKMRVERDAALYKEGFQAAQRADVTGTAGFAPLHPVRELSGARRAEQQHASEAINRFLDHRGRALKPNHYTTTDLAAEREKVAHELGLKSLTHGGRLAAPTQKLSNMPVPLSPADKSNLVIVDPYGRPITAPPSDSQYPGMGNNEFMDNVAKSEESAASEPEQPAANQDKEEGKEASEQAAAGGEEDDKVEAAIAKVAKASAEHEAALQAEVRAQEAIIKDLEGKVQQVSARKQPEEEEQQQEAAADDGRSAAVHGDAKPALGSWEMAKFANNVDSGLGGLGTNIVHMYDDLAPEGPYKEVADEGNEEEKNSDRNFAVDRAEVERAEAERVADDLNKVRAEAKVFGGRAAVHSVDRQLGGAFERQQARVNLGTIGSVAPVPMTGEGGDELAPQQVKAEVKVEPPTKAKAAAEAEDKVAEEAEEKGVLPPPSKAEEEAEEEEGDLKPALGSFDMAKFANNVESGGGSLGTNVVWMYDNLAKRGPYKAVESGAIADEDDEPDEYRSVPTAVLHSIASLSPNDDQHLQKVASRTYAKIEGSMQDAPQQI